jgi:hypothetical protein
MNVRQTVRVLPPIFCLMGAATAILPTVLVGLAPRWALVAPSAVSGYTLRLIWCVRRPE